MVACDDFNWKIYVSSVVRLITYVFRSCCYELLGIFSGKYVECKHMTTGDCGPKGGAVVFSIKSLSRL